jgi:hypothetical protein
MLVSQPAEPGPLGQPHHRNQPCRRHQVRVVEHRRDLSRSVKESHLKDALPGDGVWTVASPRLPAGKGILASRHAQPAQLIGGSGLSERLLLRVGYVPWQLAFMTFQNQAGQRLECDAPLKRSYISVVLALPLRSQPPVCAVRETAQRHTTARHR